MKPYRTGNTLFALSPALLALLSATVPLRAQMDYRQQNLVSDVPGWAAHTDPNLVNAWGISEGPTSPFWVSDNGTGKTTLYDTKGHPLPLVVTIPNPGGGASAPTGQVFNGTSAFNGDRFIFASEDGTITGWRGALGHDAEILSDMSSAGAIYKGIALGSIGANTYVYAADFHNKRIDVLPSSGAPGLTGHFMDASLPSNYAPFNVQNVGGSLYVTYAQTVAGSGDEADGAGLGFVDKFDLNGNLLMRVASNGVLNAPWAVTMAPSTFCKYSGDLLVGNFGDGMINVFDPATGNLLGSLKDSHGNPLVIDGLWGLHFGNGAAGGNANSLYFAAGPDGEAHGLFGSITPVPEASTYSLAAAAGLLLVCGVAYRRRVRRSDPALAAPAA